MALCNGDEVDDNTDVIFVTMTDKSKSAFGEYIAVKDDSLAIKLNDKAKVASIFIGDKQNEIIIITEKVYNR